MTEPAAGLGSKRVQILIRGDLGEGCAAWFENLSVELQEDGNTMLNGDVSDRSELYGIIARLRDLGLELISIERTDIDADSPNQLVAD